MTTQETKIELQNMAIGIHAIKKSFEKHTSYQMMELLKKYNAEDENHLARIMYLKLRS